VCGLSLTRTFLGGTGLNFNPELSLVSEEKLGISFTFAPFR
jgi:hypothetical protein